MTTVLLVRHAAHGLLGRVLAGRMPGVGLSEEGRAQAERLGTRFSSEAVAAIWSSPLDRAQQTAQPIAQALGLPVETVPGLLEIDFGRWTGQSFGALEPDPLWRLWNEKRAGTRCPGGETMPEAQARILAELERARALHPNGTVVMVAHADLIKAAVAWVLGLSLDQLLRFEIDPASVSTAQLEPWGARLLSLNARSP